MGHLNFCLRMGLFLKMRMNYQVGVLACEETCVWLCNYDAFGFEIIVTHVVLMQKEMRSGMLFW